MSKVITLTTSNFDTEVLASDVPVVVDYWAPWCGPCRMLGPVIGAQPKSALERSLGLEAPAAAAEAAPLGQAA